MSNDERDRFAQPLGKLISGTREETIREVVRIVKEYLKLDYSLNFYIVGDIVTKDFLASDFLKSYIKLCIIDEMTQRNKIVIEIKGYFEEIIESVNPPGKIQNKNVLLIDEIIKSKKRTLLRITEGEEDLLVIPLVVALPLEDKVKHLVFYGQPPVTDSKHPIPEGIVLVDVKKSVKNSCNTILRKFFV